MLEATMHAMRSSGPKDSVRAIESLQDLRRFNGSADVFWATFLEHASGLVGARYALVCKAPEADPAATLTTIAAWPDPTLRPPTSGPAAAALLQVVAAAVANGACIQVAPSPTDAAQLAISMESGGVEPPDVLLLFVPPQPVDRLETAILLLRLARDIPASFRRELALQRATADVVKLSEVLDIVVVLSESTRYMKAAMTFTGELASRFGCGRVSLGWRKGHYVRIQTMSHVEEFEKRSSPVQALEACMEECLDQDEEMVWPRPSGAGSVLRSHEEYAQRFAAGNLVSLPLRIGGEPLAVITCERSEPAFSAQEVESLRLACDQASRRLGDLRRRDRWFLARLVAWFGEKLGWFLGVEYTFAKLGGILLAVAVIAILSSSMEYRVEGAFLLKTNDHIFLPAAFDGYIEEVHARIGDVVKKGDLLLALDTKELALDEAGSLAEISRQSREAEKSEVKRDMAGKRIAEAQVAQAQARLAKTRYQLDNARVRAPFDGVVVEGDLSKMLGAPVRKGDVLYKVARIDRMYAEIDVDEKDVHELRKGTRGEIAFVSRPASAYPIVIERIDPVALNKDSRNVFTLRGTFKAPAEGWFRPGMSGVAKLDIGRRNILWILSHRTIEYLQLTLWI